MSLIDASEGVIAKLVKLSVCACGYGFFNDNVPLGKLYLVFPKRTANGFLRCGGCKKLIPVVTISVWEEGTTDATQMPIETLEIKSVEDA